MELIPRGFCFRAVALVCSLAILPGEQLCYARSSPVAKPLPPAQATANPKSEPLNAGELDSLVAPIALYPDPLIAQILAAATYPVQIVEAQRWMQENRSLTGKALVEAAGKQPWDASIQALVAFPTVLQMLDESLSWTSDLGNAFLAQQTGVMAAVQRMRAKAQASGNLESNPQQQVQETTVEGQPTITIQPADPQVIYVPSYEPAAVYGAAESYPYPAVAYPTGGAIAAGAISFGVGVAVGAIFSGCCGGGWGWGWGFNWGAHPSLYVNNNFFNSNRNTFVNRGNWGNNYVGNGRGNWNHNPGWGRGGRRPSQLPSNLGNRPGSIGGANRRPGNGAAGRGRPSQLPSRPNAGNNRPGGRGRPSQLPASARNGNRPGGRGGATHRPATVGANRNRGSRGGSTGSASRRAPQGWNGSRGSAQRRSFNGGGGRSRGGGGGRSRGGGGGRSRGGGGGRSRGGGGRRR